jgi:probable F420-dependent oxidoreductase
VAQRAEALGFESLWLGDHLAVPASDENSARDRFYEAITTLGYLVGVTSRIQLGTGVLIVPYRHPILMATSLATADRLSNGRIIFGGASGWMEEEFEALSVPFERRGARTDEYLQVIKHLWTTPRPHTFHGRYVRFENIKFAPELFRVSPPPVWIGGNSRAAVQRAVDHGDAWFPLHISLERMERRVAHLRDLCEQRGREEQPVVAMSSSVDFGAPPQEAAPWGFQGSPEQLVEELRAYEEAGLDYLVLDFPRTSLQALCATMETFAERVMPALVSA